MRRGYEDEILSNYDTVSRLNLSKTMDVQPTGEVIKYWKQWEKSNQYPIHSRDEDIEQQVLNVTRFDGDGIST